MVHESQSENARLVIESCAMSSQGGATMAAFHVQANGGADVADTSVSACHRLWDSSSRSEKSARSTACTFYCVSCAVAQARHTHWHAAFAICGHAAFHPVLQLCRLDNMLLGGAYAEVWMRPGKDACQGA